MNKSVYMLGELMSGFRTRAWLFGGLAVGAIVLLSTILALFMAVAQPESVITGAKLIVTPNSTVESDINGLIFRLEQAPTVAGVRLIPGEANGHKLEIELYPEIAAVAGRTELSVLEGVQHVQIPVPAPEGFIKSALGAPESAIFIVGGLVALAIGMLLMIFLGLRSAYHSFRGDLEILEEVGVSPGLLRMPFLLYGGLIGLLGAILTLILTYSMAIWVPALAITSEIAPELLKPNVIEQMAVTGVAISLLIGILFCLSIGFWIYRYPRPFSRSRSSSSSAAVSTG